jgi:hypothetical protein
MITHPPLLRLVITTHDGSKSLGSIRHDVTGYSGPFAHIAVGRKHGGPQMSSQSVEI